MGVPRSLDPAIVTVAVGLWPPRGGPAPDVHIPGSVSASGVVFSVQLQWLLDNYADHGGGVSQKFTYKDPLPAALSEHKLDPVNAASFGKRIRSVFMRP